MPRAEAPLSLSKIDYQFFDSLSLPRGARRVSTQFSEDYFFEPALLTKVDHLVPRPLLALVGGLRPSFA